MASIFTFDTEPSRVLSPWPSAQSAVARSTLRDGRSFLAGLKMPHTEVLANCDIKKLEPEPQEGSTEYKLHLLLRPRRSYLSTSTVQNVSGSYLSKSRAPRSHSETDIKQGISTPALALSSQSRQNRLQHLTTQLLWRLQQSSPYHSSSKSSLVLPILPEADVERSALKGPGPLISGLEESSGALYEIGVSDDGTLVGLARDELEESLAVLRAMAFSLGCNVQVLRLIIVGDCQWSEEVQSQSKLASRLRKEKLWIAEVLVAPNLHLQEALPDISTLSVDDSAAPNAPDFAGAFETSVVEPRGEQIRVSLTGSTTSGKSSLLGTLSTSTLDNGRGKSRLSLLKHRHEIVSGVTSSLAQELFAYQDAPSIAADPRSRIINYASGNVSSWEDIHNASDAGRLVFVTDSAGHPRYRRTTVRGLVSWAPHWTLCCIAADDQDESSGKMGATASSSEVLGSAGAGIDLSKAHLDLCLKLNLPLVIVITKLDLATKTGLRDMLAKILTTLKSAGRKPVVLSPPPNEKPDVQLEFITKDNEDIARKAVSTVLPHERQLIVPIILTSSVTGSGIGRLHALLHRLPVAGKDVNPPSITPLSDGTVTRKLFHVDEVFAMPPSLRPAIHKDDAPSTILSGYLQYGSLDVGERVLVGPCALDDAIEAETSSHLQHARSYPGLMKGPAKALSLAYDNDKLSPGDFPNNNERLKSSMSAQTWQEARISSIRNLRLPVRRLSEGQVGTVGITFDDMRPHVIDLNIRRGMVMLPSRNFLADEAPSSYYRFSAVFQEAGLPAWPGVLVVVYIASIRASAKISEVRALEVEAIADDIFYLDDNGSDEGSIVTPMHNQQTEITFEFVNTREWFEVGTQVLVTPGGSPSLTGQPEQREVGSAGLDGYVGKITQATVSTVY